MSERGQLPKYTILFEVLEDYNHVLCILNCFVMSDSRKRCVNVKKATVTRPVAISDEVETKARPRVMRTRLRP